MVQLDQCVRPSGTASASYGNTSPERINPRNGYQHRDFDTQASPDLLRELLGTFINTLLSAGSAAPRADGQGRYWA